MEDKIIKIIDTYRINTSVVSGINKFPLTIFLIDSFWRAIGREDGA